ncbi:DUF6074 family protein [Brevundimonas faecalis]|uniref:DUF6074 family protein n=1 Tax=Brevundimonas faecalis TaxID=947378 RepID=UPI00361600F2
MAEMIPFPLAARRRFIDRQAAVAHGMKPESGERHITRMIDQQREILLRKGVRPDTVNRECVSMEAAIRAALWRAVMTPGGAV